MVKRLVEVFTKQIMTQKLLKLKINLIIIIMNNHNHDKFITTPVFNTLVADVFNARLARANLITKTD